MNDKICYNCTALAGTNKAGKLTPDANGYYTVILGAFDFPNSAGAIYPWKSAQKLFDASGALKRRMATGQQRGEYGHPKMTPGMTKSNFIQRICTIEETKVAFHISEVWIDKETIKTPQGRAVTAVMGKVKPSGPHGESLRAQLENPDENVAFSVRSLTRDVRLAGQTVKHMTTLVTWDYVNEPGISVATKYNNPSLESLDEPVLFGESDFDGAKEGYGHDGVSLESVQDFYAVVDQQGFTRKVSNLDRISAW